MNVSPINRFRNLLRKYKTEIRQIYVVALFIGVVNLTLPLGIQAIINFLQTGVFTTTWLLLVGFVIFGIALTGFLQVYQLRIVENIQQDLFARSAFEFAFRLPKIAFLQLDKVHAPELVNRFFDTLTIQKGLPKILIDFSLAIFQITFGLVLLTIYSPYFVLLGFALAIILWFIFKFTGPKGLATSLVESKYKYQLAHWLEEIGRMNRSFKIFATHKLHLHKTDKSVGMYLTAREKHFKIILRQFRLFIAFKVIVAAGLLLLGGFLVFKEQMNIGQFVAAEIVIILIINSVEKVLRTIDIIYDVLTALDKIGYVTDLKLDENYGTATVTNQKGLAIRAEEISFGFPEQKRKVLDNLSLQVNHNEKVVLSGKSGSGKSLLLQILSGIHQIDDGELYINDVPFNNYEKEQLYSTYGVSLPVNQIFEGTFKENILLGRNISDTEIAAVTRVLNLQEYLLHQPKGIDSFVDTGGRRLPRTILQKLLVARIIINKPQLLLMEDPLQFIEESEKKRIIDYLTDQQHNWSILVVSDFYYWKEKCDRIIELTK